jgi:methylenetetrahydrofolate reductase (NADPH)
MLFAIELTPIAGGGSSGSTAAASSRPAAEHEALLRLEPDLVFVAEPPGVDNAAAVAMLQRRVGSALVPHLTTRNRDRADVAERVGGWRGAGIDRVLALRGDQTTACDLSRDQHLRSGRELAGLLLALDPELEVWCAAYPETHPEAASPEADLRALRQKAALGVAAAVCQFTFEPEPWLRFRDRVRAAGIALPLLAGILPVTADPALPGFARACGAAIPPAVQAALERHAADPAALERWGVEHAVALAERYAREGADGVEVFSWNHAAAATAIAAVIRADGARLVS